MRRTLRLLLLWGLLLLLQAGCTVSFGDRANGARGIGLDDIEAGTIPVPGLGHEVEGLSLLDKPTRHAIGDDSLWAGRHLNDQAWPLAEDSGDSTVAGQGIHWLRRTFEPDPDLKESSLVIYASARAPFTLYVDGEPVLHGQAAPAQTDVPPYGIPVRLKCDGAPESVAMRIAGTPGAALAAADVHLTLHAASVHFAAQEFMLHRGIFVGINLIILLLAWVGGRSDRDGKGWYLLALFACIGALEVITEIGGDQAMLGGSPNLRQVLARVNDLLLPWQPYVLIMALGAMGAGTTPRRRRLYTKAAITVAVLTVATMVGVHYGLIDNRNGLEFSDTNPALLVVGLAGLVLFGLIVAWFFLEVVRLGLRLLRTPGFERWIGAGAVASTIVALLLKVAGGITGSALGPWLKLVAEYCSFVAVPVSIAVYMAIRSAHNNRLVERQRDELDQAVKERTAELQQEKERSDELLLNILPEEVAGELKATGRSEAVRIDQVTVLFTDFQDFTDLAARTDPAQLVEELNECFSAFDRITEKFGIEKIKTIGDAYMAAGGLPVPNRSHATDTVLAALEIRDFILAEGKRKQAMGLPWFRVRIGIHTGPVVAGIVGVKKFQYDIWGDTVNTASRMESSGEAGRVNISAATYAQVKGMPNLSFAPRGMVEAKGKGRMEMYFVEAAE